MANGQQGGQQGQGQQQGGQWNPNQQQAGNNGTWQNQTWNATLNDGSGGWQQGTSTNAMPSPASQTGGGSQQGQGGANGNWTAGNQSWNGNWTAGNQSGQWNQANQSWSATGTGSQSTVGVGTLGGRGAASYGGQ